LPDVLAVTEFGFRRTVQLLSAHEIVGVRASPYLDQPLADRGERRSWRAHGGKKDASIAGTTLTAAISHAIISSFPER
jgi:hypothetical protein